ncbi:hypothetical protein GGI22_006593, partial [Coemansia erecta]
SLTSVTKAPAPATTQKPRIVQIGNPQAIRVVEADTGQQGQLPPGSPLRSVANGWDSNSEFSDSGDSDAESFSPAADANRPMSQAATAHQTGKPELGANLPFGNDNTDSFSNVVLSATNGIETEHGSAKR